jgi:hypothetical protein
MSPLACGFAAMAIAVLLEIRDDASGGKRGWFSAAWYGLAAVWFVAAMLERLVG